MISLLFLVHGQDRDGRRQDSIDDTHNMLLFLSCEVLVARTKESLLSIVFNDQMHSYFRW